MAASRAHSAHTEPAAASASQRKALSAAAQWVAQLGAEDASSADHRAWQDWYRADPDHQWAWSRVQALQTRLRAVPGTLSAATLHLAQRQRAPQPQLDRRAVLKGLGALTVSAWLGYELAPWQTLRADYRTAVGETQATTLPDGTRIVLDTRSAVRVDFDTRQRRLHLLSGEVLIETAKDPSPHYRPFTVHAAHGEVQALGTRFSVRQDAESTRVVVLQDTVEVRPRLGTALPLRLRAGQQVRFSDKTVSAPAAADESLVAWVDRRLVISDWRLADFVTELNRYRSGWLRCDPAVAQLRLSGAFPLHNTDQALLAVERALPVSAQYRSRYWVTLQSR